MSLMYSNTFIVKSIERNILTQTNKQTCDSEFHEGDLGLTQPEP